MVDIMYVEQDEATDLVGKTEIKLPQPHARGTSLVNVSDNERIISAVVGGFLTAIGFYRGSWLGSLLALTGTGLVYRAASGYCPVNEQMNREVELEKSPLIIASRSMTIRKSPDEVYAFYRKLENLPRFMKHVKEVREISDTRSYWTVTFPRFKQDLSWEAEIVDDEPGKRISYRSLPGAKVDNSGEIYLKEAPSARGTEIKVTLSYRPPQGDLGKQVAKLFNKAFEQMVRDDLHRLKQYLETGEVVSTEGQPAAR
ncbi:MAG: SRPBCC family protein [Cyclobacteriaceae bacterium]